jgi:hypothetical protein
MPSNKYNRAGRDGEGRGTSRARRRRLNNGDRPKTRPEKKQPGLLRRFVAVLGPGLITGAADDDPSGVATYSIAGAQLGTSLL